MLEILIEQLKRHLNNKLQPSKNELANPCVYHEVTNVIPVNHPPNAKKAQGNKSNPDHPMNTKRSRFNQSSTNPNTPGFVLA